VNRPLRSKYLFLSLLLVLAISACSPPAPLPVPVPPRVAFDTLIVSDPNATRCNVNGKTGATMTITTPRLVPIPELGAPVTVRCFAQGYWTEQVTILAGSKNPLLTRVARGEQITPANAPVRGGEIGPGGEYPREIKVTLRRDGFDSTDERDSYYAEQIHRVAAGWTTLIEQAKAECESNVVSQKGRTPTSLPKICRDGLRRLEVLMNGELQVVEQQRRRSRIP
jgi:hypothetical protein